MEIETFERNGFTYKGNKQDGWRVTCDQCAAAVINGIPCHETGCPNSRGRADDVEEQEDY